MDSMSGSVVPQATFVKNGLFDMFGSIMKDINCSMYKAENGTTECGSNLGNGGAGVQIYCGNILSHVQLPGQGC